MVVYEVNLEVERATYPAYYAWLCEHVREIVALPGFVQAQILEPLELDEIIVSAERQQVTASYLLTDETALQNYLKHHAPRLRQQGLDKFGNKFTATRRIFKITAEV